MRRRLRRAALFALALPAAAASLFLAGLLLWSDPLGNGLLLLLLATALAGLAWDRRRGPAGA